MSSRAQSSPVREFERPARAASGKREKRKLDGEEPLGAMGKALSVLEIIVAAGRPMSMAEIVRSTGLTKPTAHRVTTLLSVMGLIERDVIKRGFIEGPRLISLSFATLGSAAPRSMRHAILRSISERCGETSNFGILSGAEVLYLDRVEAKWPLGLRLEAGSRVPIHCTAIGKLLLSLMPSKQRDQMIASIPLVRSTSRTITDPVRLRQALDRIALTRIGVDDREFIDGVVCVAVPVPADNGHIIGAVAVAAPDARISLDQAMQFIPFMRDAAARLGATFSTGI